ncbi:thioredoxin [Echinicola sp. 20G]|uniref:thioredoxin n=1 Tax=Echinicola sp. 20G TaxID=2781961 RepID=UPI00191096C1|nr:thioredoxin [Echinicola sp. 20G]
MAKKKFKEIIAKSEEAVLVDFYADWCGPCQTMSPIVQEVANEFAGKVKVLKVNIDKNQQAALNFAVRSIPHFILFKKGKILWRKGGLMTKRELVSNLKGYL